MTSYGDWEIGGVSPSWIESVDWSNIAAGQITLKCVAFKDETDDKKTDPRVEIKDFTDISSNIINNTPLLNGGTKVQVGGGGSIITITEKDNSWTGALHTPSFNEDDSANDAIEYTLQLEVELSGIGGSYVYTPKYTSYNNITYYFYSDHSTNPSDAGLNGTEIGEMIITETQNVKRVEVYGSCCCGPAYLDINGQTQYWHYSHDHLSGDSLPSGFEKLIYDLDTSSTTLTLQTGSHLPSPSGDSCSGNHGCWLQWVRVVYE